MIEWSSSTDSVDWPELSEMYRLASLGNKSPDWLRTAFSNSMFRFFAREEGALRQSPSVERDAALNAYARDVLCKVAAEECGSIRLYIVRSSDFGARTLSNGTIEIGAGLMWRSANEGQLAFVLARQAVHLAEAHPDRRVEVLFVVQLAARTIRAAAAGHQAVPEADVDGAAFDRAIA